MENSTDNQNKLVQRIIDLREEHNWTQKDLADRMGFDKVKMNKIENGNRAVSSDEVLAFAHKFDVSTDYLLGRTEKRSESSSSDGPTDLDDPNTILRFEGRQIPQKDIELMKQIFRRMREEH